eukprot:SAG31_NODE_650_length_13187_cov_3.011843_9_plen_74_part_00
MSKLESLGSEGLRQLRFSKAARAKLLDGLSRETRAIASSESLESSNVSPNTDRPHWDSLNWQQQQLMEPIFLR